MTAAAQASEKIAEVHILLHSTVERRYRKYIIFAIIQCMCYCIPGSLLCTILLTLGKCVLLIFFQESTAKVEVLTTAKFDVLHDSKFSQLRGDVKVLWAHVEGLQLAVHVFSQLLN